MTSILDDPRVSLDQIPQGSFVVVVSYARVPWTPDPEIQVFLKMETDVPISPSAIPMGVTVYLGDLAMPGQAHSEISYEPVVWREGTLKTALRASRARSRTEPVLSWVCPLRGQEPVYAPQGLASLPSDAVVVIGRRARWCQDQASFDVIRRHIVNGQQCDTVSSVDTLRPGQQVWLATRYLAHDEHSDLSGWTLMEVFFTDKVRDDLLFDMWALTEPRTGGSYFDRDRFPRYVPLWQTFSLAIFVAVCGVLAMTDGTLRGFALGGIFFGMIYLAAWLLQGSPDPYVRRENVDGWHFALSVLAALTSGARAVDSGNDRRLLSVGMMGFWAGLAYEDRKIRRRHRDERMARVR